MIGSNIEATRYSGVNTKRVLVLIYALSGAMCAIAGIIMLARFNSVRVGHGESYLLITVLACFLGGVNPFGGFGRVMSVFLALVILQVLSSGLNLLGANQHLATAVWGLLLIARDDPAVAVGTFRFPVEEKRWLMREVHGFGVHTSMWAMGWTREAAERAVAAATGYKVDFIEIALLQPAVGRRRAYARIAGKEVTRAVCSLGLPESGLGVGSSGRRDRLSRGRDRQDGRHGRTGAVRRHLRRHRRAHRQAADRKSSTTTSRARLTAAAKPAKTRGIELGIEAVNRYENHLINTGAAGR